MRKKGNFPRIPDSEFHTRMEAVKQKMGERNLDLLVLFANALDPGHVRYLSDVVGINESSVMVIPLRGGPIVCSGQACHAWSKHKSRLADVRIFPEVGEVAGAENLPADQFAFSKLFQELGQQYAIHKIGTVGTLTFPHIIYAQLQSAFPQAEMVNAEPLMFELRLRKSESEIACMRKAGEILDDSFCDAVGKIRPGWTELDIQAEIVAGILREGAEGTGVAWDPMIPSGPEQANLGMNRNTRRKVRAREIICLQAGAVYEGMNATLSTPLVLGKIPAEIKRAVNAANAAMRAAIQALQPGATSREVNAAGKAALRRAGYEQYSPYPLMHHIGCLERESPRMAEDQEFALGDGMTVCIDVFLFRLPWGSFRIKNTLAVTAQGSELLTKFNDEFVAPHFA